MSAAIDGGRIRRWQLSRPLDFARTLLPLRHGAGDVTTHLRDGVFWRASRTPEGVGRLALSRQAGEVVAQAWGPGADWLLGSVPGLLGEDDDWSGLDVEGYPVLASTLRSRPGLRLCRSGLILDSLVPAVLEQRVTGGEAFRAWRNLVRAYGQPAPGPAEPAQWVMPEPAALLAVPSWDWHRFGVDGQRHRTVRAVATVAGRLEECVSLAAAAADHPGGAGHPGGVGHPGGADHLRGAGRAGFAAATDRLCVVPGVGQWTAAETTLRALGDPDAVSVGDFHLKNRVGFALTGAARTDDATMVELLEPWRGQRARIVRLIELSGLKPPKYGPKFAPKDMRSL